MRTEPYVTKTGVEYYTLAQVASMLGIHRVSLLRAEQANRIPKARWVEDPMPRRAYLKEDVESIISIWKAMRAAAIPAGVVVIS